MLWLSDGVARDMGTHPWRGRGSGHPEISYVAGAETGRPDGSSGVSIDAAAVPKEVPGGHRDMLYDPERRASRCGDVFDEQEPAARPEYALDLGQHVVHVGYRAQDERRDDNVRGTVVHLDGARCTGQDLGLDSRRACSLTQGFVHVWIWLDPDPAAVTREIFQVGTRSRPNLDDRPGHPGKQFPFSFGEVFFVFRLDTIVVAGEKPGVEPLSRTGGRIHCSDSGLCATEFSRRRVCHRELLRTQSYRWIKHQVRL